MASPRLVIFLILVRIRLPAHERTSGRSQSGGSHNSELDRLANRAQVGPAASEHLPQAVASVWDSYLTDSNCQCWYLVWHSSWSCTAGLVNLKASQIFLQVSCAGARLRARVWSRCRSAAASAGSRQRATAPQAVLVGPRRRSLWLGPASATGSSSLSQAWRSSTNLYRTRHRGHYRRHWS
jgi:hypothetical protein